VLRVRPLFFVEIPVSPLDQRGVWEATEDKRGSHRMGRWNDVNFNATKQRRFCSRERGTKGFGGKFGGHKSKQGLRGGFAQEA
jgi:hypothetical protein